MPSESPGLAVEALDHFVLNVRDVEVSADWYCRVLGMQREDFRLAPERPARTCVRFGRSMINLRPLAASAGDWFTALDPGAGNHDLCFLTRSAPEAVRAHLAAEGVAIVTGPGPRRGARGEIASIYCRDPDGSLVEISSYPAERDA
jgi:catechol 2,3-dioxygenase-like lactoylglutathione lyase family enzyme